MAFKLKKRCVRCLKVLRDDGTCQYPKCCLYVAESPKKLSATDTTAGAANTTSDTSGTSVPGEAK